MIDGFRRNFETQRQGSIPDSGSRVSSRVWGLEFRVWALGFRVKGLGFKVGGLGFRV